MVVHGYNLLHRFKRLGNHNLGNHNSVVNVVVRLHNLWFVAVVAVVVVVVVVVATVVVLLRLFAGDGGGDQVLMDTCNKERCGSS